MKFEFTSEQLSFYDQVFRFAREQIAPKAAEHDYNCTFDREAFRKMGEFGLLGIHLPEEYGGSGSNVVTACMAGEACGHAAVGGGFTLAWGAHTYLCADTLYRHGNKEQRDKYLPKLISGEWVGCMGLTEPNAGSDVAGLGTTAVKKGDRYVLNGSKIFITNGPVADVAVVYATLDKSKRHGGISAFIVDKGTKGFTTGAPLKKMCVKSSTTSELFFDDCEIPAENLLGQEGNGFLMALQTLEWDRSALLAPFVGGLQFAIEECSKYAKARVQFGRPIASFQAIQHKIARMKITYESARNLLYRIACSKDAGNPINHLLAAVAKLWVSEAGMKVSYDAVQVHGGYGLMHEYPVERMFRDTRLGTIGGGTSEIQKTIISRFYLSGGL